MLDALAENLKRNDSFVTSEFQGCGDGFSCDGGWYLKLGGWWDILSSRSVSSIWRWRGFVLKVGCIWFCSLHLLGRCWKMKSGGVMRSEDK